MIKEQIWSDEAGIQVKFERRENGTVRITRILTAENGHSYPDEETAITIRGWRWDRVVNKMNEVEPSDE